MKRYTERNTEYRKYKSESAGFEYLIGAIKSILNLEQAEPQAGIKHERENSG